MSIVTLDIHVEDLTTVLGLFDRIEVWRSPTENGTYVEITDEPASPARLVGTVEAPWNVSSLVLSVSLDDADPIDIVFVGTDPIDLASAIAQINDVLPGVASESELDSGLLALSSLTVGTQASLQVSGDAPPVLGISESKVTGRSIRIFLTSPTTEYQFTDFTGDPDFFYKTRYSNSVSGRVSGFSDARKGSPQTVLPNSALALAQIHLTDGAGKPIINRRVILVPQAPFQVPSTEYALLPGFDRVIISTDDLGFAQTNLIIGVRYRLLVEGSQFQREFTVPNESPFDLMQVATEAPDHFSIVQAPPRPIRLS